MFPAANLRPLLSGCSEYIGTFDSVRQPFRPTGSAGTGVPTFVPILATTGSDKAPYCAVDSCCMLHLTKRQEIELDPSTDNPARRSTMVELLVKRRTQYSLGKDIALSNEEIDSLIRDVVRLSPSAFNSQSSRVVILHREENQKLWEIVKSELSHLVEGEARKHSFKKIDSFAAGVGAVLFFEDRNVVRILQDQWPLYADHFPDWSEQASGMVQLSVWTALADVGLGASLQHYNPLIDAKIKRHWDLPDAWRLRAQMPFGSNDAPFPEKTIMSDDDRFRSFFR